MTRERGNVTREGSNDRGHMARRGGVRKGRGLMKGEGRCDMECRCDRMGQMTGDGSYDKEIGNVTREESDDRWLRFCRDIGVIG